MWCSSGPVPVAIDAAHTGVTDGNAATQSSTCCPRSSTRASVGARPLATARSSIAGFMASITARTSLRGTVLAYPQLAQDAQARVLLALAPAAAGDQPPEAAEHEQRQRRAEGRGAPPPPAEPPPLAEGGGGPSPG